MNARLIIFTLMLPTGVCPMESSPLLLSPDGQTDSESFSSPTALHSPSSSSKVSDSRLLTITIDRNHSQEPLISPRELETVPRAQKSLLTAYAMGASVVMAFLTGFSVCKSSCNP